MALAGLLAGFLALIGFASGEAGAAPPDPCPSTCRPAAPGQGAQVGVWQGSGTTFAAGTVDRAETQVGHESAIIPPLKSTAAYSYSLVGETENHYILRMGYIVIGADGGLARWFIRIYDPNGREVYWKLSRAGEANPPPGCSACSGDTTTDGYPYSFGLTQTNTWTFWFDWISKAQYKNSSLGKTLIRVYYLGEVTGDVPGTSLEPRKALTTYRVTKGSGAWLQPAATVYRAPGVVCDATVYDRMDYDVDYSPSDLQLRNDGKTYHSIVVGSLGHVAGPSISGPCAGTGDVLWTYP